MLVDNPTDKNEISQYLKGEFSDHGQTCKSSYFAALENARMLGGRCLKDGTIERHEKIGSWPSACLYLILIDHIGNMFEKKGVDQIKKSSFKRALHNFTNLKEVEIDTLYQLRCSFLHQFNLYNNDKRYTPRHFSVNRGSDLIKFPEKGFSGKLNEISPQNATKISLAKIA